MDLKEVVKQMEEKSEENNKEVILSDKLNKMKDDMNNKNEKE